MVSLASDITFGRCSQYREMQPVEQTCSPEIARQLAARGYEQVRAPIPIVDSFFPPDFCTAFAPDHKQLQAGGIRWPDARHAALLRLLAASPAPNMTLPRELASDDAQWLL